MSRKQSGSTDATRVRRMAALTLTMSALALGCSNESTVAPMAPRHAGSASKAGAGTTIPGHYIVRFADDELDAPGLARALVAQAGGELQFTYTAAIKGFSAALPEQALDGLRHNPHVASIEADQVVRADGTELNPTWGLDRIDQRTRPVDHSYSYASDGAGVNVYIIDTGIRTTHTEFSGRALGAYTAISDGWGTSDCSGHGTHVAGTVGGVKYGVAKAVRLYSVRVLDCTGTGPVSGVIAGIDWVTQNRVLPAVANMSLGGGLSSTLNAAVQNSINAGVTYAVAAGNNAADGCNYSPSSAAQAITVASSWNGDGFSGFSNYGSCVDLIAPGEAIRSAAIVDDTSSVLKGGTSMASPHVAGVAALYLSANPTATPAQVAAVIVSNATQNIVTSVPAGTANLLLYSNVVAVSPPPTDTTTTPPPTPPPADTTTTPPPAPVVDAPPVASFTSNCPRGKCTFDASASSDDKGITSYSWNFGDGASTSSGLAKTSHTYTKAGTYKVTMTVTDTGGQKTSKTATLTFKKL